MTETYRPPELFGVKTRGGTHKALSEKVDIWSYGVFLFYACTGHHRFPMPTKACVDSYVACFKMHKDLRSDEQAFRRLLMQVAWAGEREPAIIAARTMGERIKWLDAILLRLRPTQRDRHFPSTSFFEALM